MVPNAILTTTTIAVVGATAIVEVAAAVVSATIVGVGAYKCK